MFVDELTIKVEAGKGGDGCTSFAPALRIPSGQRKGTGRKPDKAGGRGNRGRRR